MAEQRGNRSDLTTATPALLLLVGRADLAEKVYQSKRAGRGYDPAGYSLFREIERLLNREATQSIRDESDKRGLESAGRLVAALTVQSELGVGPKLPQNNRMEDELSQARALYADLERRVENPQLKPVDVAAIARKPRAARVAALIDDLDRVSQVVVSNPGGAYFMSDPICKTLAGEGPEAVPALIDVIERDKRLTRVIGAGRSFNSMSYVFPVRSAAWQILLAIWPAAQSYGDPGIVPIPPPPSAEVLRKAWAEDSKLSEPERWLNVLKDDSADWRTWIRAARFLVKPSSETWSAGWTVRSVNGLRAQMTAEPLRTLHGAEISEILSRRALGLSSSNSNSSLDAFHCGDALTLADCLFRWDRSAALPTMTQVCRNTLDGLKRFGSYANPNQTVVGPFGAVIADRLALGDRSAVADYAAMAPYAKFEFFGLPSGFLKPLWTHPGDPGIQEQGRALFRKLADQLASDRPGEAFGATQSAAELPGKSPILAFPPFRELLVEGLRNSHGLGEGRVESEGPSQGLRYKFEGGAQGAFTWNPSEGKGSQVGDLVKFSVGDALAFRLTHSFVKGWPPFSIAAPNRERETDIAKLIAFLQNDRFDWVKFSRTSPFSNVED
jgi:hypothetical protein